MLAFLLSCTFISPTEVDDRIAANACKTADCAGHGSGNDDADGDGFLSLAAGGDDCDDADPTVNPAAVEVWYDGVDQDCAGDNDNDQDADGFESSAYGGDDCYDSVEDPYPLLTGDCAEPSTDIAPEDVHPGASDAVYDGTDADCSGGTDFDKDGDTYPSCEDCNDDDASIYPSDTPEIWYNGVDENCDRNDGDQDGDGFVVAGYNAAWIDPESSLAEGDCWDDPNSVPSDFVALNEFAQLAANAVNPDAEETWYDGVDGNCDGADDFDADADSYPTDAYANRAGETGPDCDDGDGAVHPGAVDAYYDGVDANCDAKSDYDQDGDAYDNGVDCDDTKASVNPGMNEDCSTASDDDCDGSADDIDGDGCTMFNKDADGDSYGTTTTACACGPTGVYTASNDDDCNDADASSYPDAPETYYDGIDEDCDGASDYDADGDGADAEAFGGDDCDDTDATVYAGAAETYYDGMDADCAGDSDYDVDGDGYDAEAGGGTDCDDFTATIHPGATETVADTVDQDCDGVDSCYTDADGDNYGTTVVVDGSTLNCGSGTGAAESTDCDDADSGDHPGATETIGNGDDEDCDSQEICFDDDDNDGYLDSAGDTRTSTDADCIDASEGTNTDPTSDCDDADSGDHPGASEITGNGDDEDCDGGERCYDDDDNDGYLDTSADTVASTDTDCADANEGTNTDLTTDCDDTNVATFPGAAPNNSTTACENDDDGDDYGDTTAPSGGTAGTDLDDAKSTCTTSLTDTDGDGYYNCQDRCADVDGDSYGTTNATAANCVTDGGHGGTTSCAGDAACIGADLDDAKGTCTTSLTDTDGDGYYNCQDRCADVDGDNYGTTNATAASCVTNGASGGTTSCAGDAACTGTDLDDAKSTCTTSLTDTDGDGYYNCQDRCADVDGDNYGTSNASASSCVTNGASGGTTSCAGDAACTSTDVDDAKSTCTTSLTDTDGDGYYNCQDQCADVDSDNYGVTNSTAATCVTNGASGGTTSCAGDAACTGTDCLDTSAYTYPGAAPNDSATACERDVDGDNYGDTSAPSGGSAGTDCDDTDAGINPAEADPTDGTYVDEDCDSFIDEDGIVAGSVLITEFFFGATTTDYDFIEFYNPTVYDIYLDAWRLDLCKESATTIAAPPYASTSCDSTQTLTFPTGAAPVIPAGGYAFICNNDTVQTGSFPCDYEFAYSGASMAAENGLLKIRSTSSTSIDTITWWQSTSGTDSWPTSGTYSVQLDTSDFNYTTNNDYSTTSLTTNPNIWCLSTGSDWTTGTPNYYGTPGAANRTCP